MSSFVTYENVQAMYDSLVDNPELTISLKEVWDAAEETGRLNLFWNMAKAVYMVETEKLKSLENVK